MKRRYTLAQINELGPYITVEYAAQLTGYKEMSIRAMLARGWVKGARWGGKSLMVHRQSLMHYIENYARGPRETDDEAPPPPPDDMEAPTAEA